ncbi:MAG: D-tyrosyl-tRNA(Tyr) deacylase [Clostridia bacterium]|nr:D-tyrosyl-tRNA(Tyr) deacylase [Clostridia bacterium]
MIAVLQRVKKAAVSVDGNVVGECGEGLYVLLGVSREDTERDAELLAEKIVGLRIFTDEGGKMNYSLINIDGEMLVVSNFTLLASYRKGKRPDYMAAAAPEEADRLYRYFTELCAKNVKKVATGVFGAHMITDMQTDGPVTIVMDSKVLSAPKNN